jgi:predicted outer membrane protein
MRMTAVGQDGMTTGSGAGQDMSRDMKMSSADQKFMMTAAMGGMAEVEMARLALEKSSSDAVK